MSPPKSEIWKYYERKGNTTALCKLCGKILKTSGNTTNLKSHMQNKHYSVFFIRNCKYHLNNS